MIVSAARLPGNAVVNGRGEGIGRVDCLMVDLNTGRIAYVVLACGGVLSLGARHCAVNWEELRLEADGKRFVMERAPGEFAQSPA